MADDEGPRNALSESVPSISSTRRPSSASGANNQSSWQHLSNSQTSDAPRTRSQQQPPSSGYGSITPNHGRPFVESPEPIPFKPQKRPATARRVSTSGPHKGQEFSVDDAREEVDRDLARQAKMASGTLRRQPSTIRRRTAALSPVLPRVDSTEEGEEAEEQVASGQADVDASQVASVGEAVEEAEEAEEEEEEEAEDPDDLSDAESFTLKDRQEAINETHPFGIRIWKPALYKKKRSVERTAEGDIHSSPGGFVSSWLWFINLTWSLIFGWWLALLAAIGALICLIFGFAPGCMEYGTVLWGLATYILYPFGKYVKFQQDEAYADEDEGEGRSISEYEQWQSGDIEEGRLFFGPLQSNRDLVGRRRNSVDSANEIDSLLGRPGRRASERDQAIKTKRRLFGRGEWSFGRVIFFLFFYGLITPSLFLVSGICWLLVFTIPMGRVTLLLFYHLRKHPLALSFHSDTARIRSPGSPPSSILLCTYRAAGLKYWKYTIDGTNIFLINLLGIVAFVIFDYFVLNVALGLKNPITNPGFIFILAIFSIIPLAYFIGQAVASISAQSSMGVGATINAFFSTVVEVFLYCVALKEGKAQLVEGSVVGSVFAGILFLPGISMCFGALKRKTQRFNVKSAGVTSTMLLFAVIGAFGPTLFYQIYGSHELNCFQCLDEDTAEHGRDCRRCFFAQAPAIDDRFYNQAVRPYTWFAAVALFLSYVIGLLFTLRTHAAVIWTSELDEKRPEKSDHTASQIQESTHQESPSQSRIGNLTRRETGGTITEIRDSLLYKRILGQSLREAGLNRSNEVSTDGNSKKDQGAAQTPHVVPPFSRESEPSEPNAQRQTSLRVRGLSEEDNQTLVRQVAELAATAAAVAARDATRGPQKANQLASTPARPGSVRGGHARHNNAGDGHDDPLGAGTSQQQGGGHDAPNWGRKKSAIILLTATLAYAIIAEILVDTVDAVLSNVEMDEKFLGIWLFALVPNTTEFLNAISFAMNGNIALSMEIGSAYALQVCLLQIPCLVLFSAIYTPYIQQDDIVSHTFTLIFPQWDMVTVILCVFLLSYMYGEGKSNYFKGSILILSYFVVVAGYYFAGFGDHQPAAETFLMSNRPVHGYGRSAR